jgi:hypothetical protein
MYLIGSLPSTGTSLSAALENPGNELQVESETTEDGPAVAIESTTLCNGEFLRRAEGGIDIMAGGDGAVQKVALVAMGARHNSRRGVEVNISGSVKGSALKAENNGAADSLP